MPSQGIDSLNVGMAASVVFSEFLRKSILYLINKIIFTQNIKYAKIRIQSLLAADG